MSELCLPGAAEAATPGPTWLRAAILADGAADRGSRAHRPRPRFVVHGHARAAEEVAA